MSAQLLNLLDISMAELHRFVADMGEKPYRARQIIQWLYQHGANSIDEMTNLSKAFRTKLADKVEIRLPQVLSDTTARDGTRKWLFGMTPEQAIETVYIPEKTRGTLCISSQVGCALNCSFCSTGKQGFSRNLRLSEIIGQVMLADRLLRATHPEVVQPITNVVVMGMGEPLLNYRPVVDALHIILSDLGFNLSKYRVTLSTSGVLPKMLDLKAECDCAMAVSLHAPTDELREQLVPLNKKYPLKELMAVCRDYFAGDKKRVITFEYVMLKGVNDQIEHAKQLLALMKDVPGKMNLIPFNPFPGTNYETSDWAQIEKFQRYLIDRGLQTWVRKTRGEDIDGACGQLVGDFKDRTGRHARWVRTGHITPRAKKAATA